ncbi:hypothetical protein M0802_010725 [Mischocyttarus mexicanus]|nr:hypothetical protein M0802_010725 [Mischocyttarus mexicanus]
MDTKNMIMDTKKMKKRKKKNIHIFCCFQQEMEKMYIFNRLQSTFKLFLCFMSFIVVLMSISYYLYIHSSLKKVDRERPINDDRQMYYVLNRNNDSTDHLKHVFTVLNNIGFKRTYDETNWNLLWSHQYPFTKLDSILRNLKPHQLINHFPGCGYITNKKHLSTSKGGQLPKAFKIPEDKDKLLSYTILNPNKYWLKKSNNHRGIKIVNASNIDFNDSESFIQEFIDEPFLIDGYKFDLGVYVVFTSIDPLRVYAYKGDVLLRFCTIKYHPFDNSQEDSYIIGDDYRPIWEVPSLYDYYTNLGYSMKDSLDAYIKSIGGNPNYIWFQIEEAIREVAIMKESLIKESIRNFGSGRNFFELVRFDFIIDKNMNVHTMEANMSPNLSSAHYPANQLLYEQVLFNLFSLIGINRRVKETHAERQFVHEMEVANKNLAVLSETCKKCHDCFVIECQLCIPCLTKETKQILIQSYKEHVNKLDFQRIFPPPITDQMVMERYSLQNQLLIKWYQGKCAIDSTWCI